MKKLPIGIQSFEEIATGDITMWTRLTLLQNLQMRANITFFPPHGVLGNPCFWIP